MNILIDALALVAGFVLLVKGADFFVEGAAGIAAKFGIPQIVIGLTIVAMGTSAPEAAVSIAAAFNGSADITIGNVLGSNIMNIFVILGLASVIIPIAVQKTTVIYEMPFMIAITAILLVLGMDGTISFVDGLILAGLFLVYMIYLLISAKNNKEEANEEAKKQKLIVQILFSIGGVVAIIGGSKLAVFGASEIAKMFGISERIIGLTVVALGTSLPELFTSVTAAKKGNADIAIGNIVGSNVFNIIFVVALTAIITPVPYAANFVIDNGVAIVAAILLWIFVLPKKKLGRIGGAVMLLGYIAYFVYLCLG